MTESKILIIDDDLSVHRALKRLLSRAGFENVMATDQPKDVLALYESFQPDLLILDLNMPEISGFEVLSMLREKDLELLESESGIRSVHFEGMLCVLCVCYVVISLDFKVLMR